MPIKKLYIVISILCLGLITCLFLLNSQKQNLALSKSEHKLEIQKKDSEIETLNQKVKDLQNNVDKTGTEKKTQPTVKSEPSESTNSAIEIEKCKALAKDYADKIAVKLYLEAYEKSVAQGDMETAQVYLEASWEPKHPANYNSIYQEKYIECLST